MKLALTINRCPTKLIGMMKLISCRMRRMKSSVIMDFIWIIVQMFSNLRPIMILLIPKTTKWCPGLAFEPYETWTTATIQKISLSSSKVSRSNSLKKSLFCRMKTRDWKLRYSCWSKISNRKNWHTNKSWPICRTTWQLKRLRSRNYKARKLT